MSLVVNPYAYFTDTNGDALNGYLYIGEVGKNAENYPIAIYYDALLTTPAPNPLTISAGYIYNGGTIAQIYAAVDYSLIAKTTGGSLVYSSLNESGMTNGAIGTITELKDFVAPYNNYAINVLGYSEAGDGGGGLFYYDANSTEDDNGGTIIEPASGSGRWKRSYDYVLLEYFGVESPDYVLSSNWIWDATVDKSTANLGTIIDPSVALDEQGTGSGLGCMIRQYSGAVNVKWFGAKGDGTTNDSPAFINAITYLAKGGVLFLPQNNNDTSYRLDSSVEIALNENCDLIIDGNFCKIELTFADCVSTDYDNNGAFRLYSDTTSNSLLIQNLTITNIAQIALPILLGNRNNITIKNIKKVYLNNVISMYANRNCVEIYTATEQVSVTNCYFDTGLFGGLFIWGCNDISVDGCVSNNHGRNIDRGYGITLSNSTTINTNATITNNKCYNNYRKGIDVHSGRKVIISNNIVETPNNLAAYGGIYAVHETDTDNITGDVIISNNFINVFDAQASIYTGSFKPSTGSNTYNSLTIEGNIIYLGANACCRIFNEYQSPDSVIVSNNIFIENIPDAGNVVAAVDTYPNSNGTTIKDFVFTNNTLYSKYSYMAYITKVDSIIISNNIIYGDAVAQGMTHHYDIITNTTSGSVIFNANILNINSSTGIKGLRVFDTKNLTATSNVINNRNAPLTSWLYTSSVTNIVNANNQNV